MPSLVGRCRQRDEPDLAVVGVEAIDLEVLGRDVVLEAHQDGMCDSPSSLVISFRLRLFR